MRAHTSNYENTFIAVAADCRALVGETPPTKGNKKSVANIQFEMISEHPYEFTSDDVLFQVHAIRSDLTEGELEAARDLFFSKGQPCFRASPLTKRYGWGIHHDTEGKIALYGVETDSYARFLHDNSLKVVKAMKSSR